MTGAVKLNTAGGGSVVVQPASSIASDVTVNVPSVNGTLVSTGSTAQVSQAMLAAGVAGNGPAFSAYQNSPTSMTANIYTKLAFQVEEFDTNNNYDNTTNYRFTPTVAGYYQVNAIFQSGQTATTNIAVYKNGATFKLGQYIATPTANPLALVSCLVYLNGTTDYIEIYGMQSATGASATGSNATYFQASLVRAA